MIWLFIIYIYKKRKRISKSQIMLMFSKNESTSKQGDDLKSKHFEERGNGTNQRASSKDPLDISIGLIIMPETK